MKNLDEYILYMKYRENRQNNVSMSSQSGRCILWNNYVLAYLQVSGPTSIYL